MARGSAIRVSQVIALGFVGILILHLASDSSLGWAEAQVADIAMPISRTRLSINETLFAQNFLTLDGQKLVMQADCNLVHYDALNNAVGFTGTGTLGTGCFVTMQVDGNLALLNGSSVLLWTSQTQGFGSYLALSHLSATVYRAVVYNADNQPIWVSRQGPWPTTGSPIGIGP